jgi:preprotein translocase SecE subunit
VVWPSRKEAANLTTVVIVLMVAMAAFLGSVDFVFQELFRFVLRLGGSGL